MHPLAYIQNITNRIINAGPFAYGDLFPACNELYAALTKLSGIDNTQDIKNRNNLMLESGKAIGLVWAGMCIKDIMRTKRFFDGIVKATRDKLTTADGKPVQILYTGTGPFATLVLPLTAIFSSKQIQFTLVEVNEHTLNNLKNLFNLLELNEYVSSMELADATAWKLPEGLEPDVFICETMQQALKTEPQVAVCLNILPQLPPNAIMIPEQIVLTAAMEKRVDNQQYNQPDAPYGGIVPLEQVFTLNKEEMLRYAERFSKATEAVELFDKKRLELPEDKNNLESEVYILTELQVYDDIRFLFNESQLSMPYKLVSRLEPQTTAVTIQYQVGSQPGLKVTQHSQAGA